VTHPPDGTLIHLPESSWQTAHGAGGMPERWDYIDGTGQTVYVVHTPEHCEGRPCAIHNPSDHNMRDFPTHFRFDRYLMERICPHGVGHPDPDDLAWQLKTFPERAPGIHGCDGCCRRHKPTRVQQWIRRWRKR